METKIDTIDTIDTIDKIDTIDQDELFVALYVIGQLKPNDKLGIYANHITIHESNNFFQKWVTRVKRTLLFETKQVSYEFIKVCVDSMEIYVHSLLERQDRLTLNRLDTYIDNAKEGLYNLSFTYKDDVNMVGKLKRQLEKLKLLQDQIHECIDKSQEE